DDRYINVSMAVAVGVAELKEQKRRAASSNPVCIRKRS
ncbi:hypothetical protein L917_03736, partial [Phytophthora nicotianae]